jgi:GNAT superfamily N-acetyltransferase
MNDIDIIDVHKENVINYSICGYKNIKKPGYAQKIDWIKNSFQEGLKLKILYSQKDKEQGMIEYIDGSAAYRPIEAKGFIAIHCIFVGFKKEYKNRGYGSSLLHRCIQDAKKEKMKGICVVTRKGPFMARNDLFLKNGFAVVDFQKPDFNLLCLSFDDKKKLPAFKKDIDTVEKYQKGLTIFRSDQCPYTVKNVYEIANTAQKKYHIDVRIIPIESAKEAQECPSAFGSFCLIFEGKILSYHPISNRRFENIMDQII